MLNKIFRSNYKGFTLIEVVVAVFVLTIGVLAVFNVVQNITVYSRVSSSRLTAVYLVQEGIELVRNRRDSNWLTGGIDWEANKANLIGLFGTETGLLGGKFNRTINISDEGEKIGVSVEVVWEEKGVAQSPVIAQTELYNWYGQ
jgi:prepilin-type N-terminal cleavage/methylation domain-containing protein